MALRQLHQEQQRDAAQQHPGAGVDRQLRHEHGVDPANEIGDAVGDLPGRFVELARQRRSDGRRVELHFGRHPESGRALVIECGAFLVNDLVVLHDDDDFVRKK